MDPESDEDRQDYIENGIFDIVTRYQWPTNLLFADEMTEEERDQLFASTDDAETVFINKKLEQAYPACKAIYVPNTIYQLCAIAYYVQHLQPTDLESFKLSVKLKELASVMSAYFSAFFFEQDTETWQGNVDLPETFQAFLDECKNHIPVKISLVEVGFLINCDLGKKIQDVGVPSADKWKSIAASTSPAYLKHQNNFNLLPVPYDQFQSDDRLDYTRFTKELDGKELKQGGIISNLIDAEIMANLTNQALLMNASKAFPQPIGIFTQGEVNKNVLTSTLRFSKLTELTVESTYTTCDVLWSFSFKWCFLLQV